MRSGAIDDLVGRRREHRVRVNMTGQLIDCSRLMLVTITDLSANGAAIAMADPPAAGSLVILSWKSHDLTGAVAWSRHKSCGIKFAKSVNVIDPIISE